MASAYITFDLFPCPFCRSERVSAIGGALSFVHYRCGACQEVWTAQTAPADGEENRASRPASSRVRVPKTRHH